MIALGAPAEVIKQAEKSNEIRAVEIYPENVKALNSAIRVLKNNYLRWSEYGHCHGLDAAQFAADQGLSEAPIAAEDYEKLLVIINSFKSHVNSLGR